jgi:2-dehydropantoate 2-reductase
MKLLVYGAGVLGSLYAARLHEAGLDVSLLARGERLAALRRHGVRLAEGYGAAVRRVPVPVVEHPAGGYDLTAVFVRTHQVDAVLESLADLDGDVLFLLNWAAGAQGLRPWARCSATSGCCSASARPAARWTATWSATARPAS